MRVSRSDNAFGDGKQTVIIELEEIGRKISRTAWIAGSTVNRGRK